MHTRDRMCPCGLLMWVAYTYNALCHFGSRVSGAYPHSGMNAFSFNTKTINFELPLAFLSVMMQFERLHLQKCAKQLRCCVQVDCEEFLPLNFFKHIWHKLCQILEKQVIMNIKGWTWMILIHIKDISNCWSCPSYFIMFVLISTNTVLCRGSSLGHGRVCETLTMIAALRLRRE